VSLSTYEFATNYLKIEDGENVTHLEVTMDYRLEASEARYALRSLLKTSVKGVVAYEFPNDGENPIVTLELWALEKLCEFENPSEVAKKTMARIYCNDLVEALYPEMVAAQQESLMPKGSHTY
jgi:regulator of RNase E activity RraB